MRSAVWNELPDDAAGPATGPPVDAMSVPATDFLGTLFLAVLDGDLSPFWRARGVPQDGAVFWVGRL
ncbi:hypothetical protein DFLDMN_005463 [Cupriavidus sp. H19C3]